MSYILFYIRYKLMIKGMREKKEIARQDILPHTILPCTSHYEGHQPQTPNGLAFMVSHMLTCTHLADQTSYFSRRIPGPATLVYPLPVQMLPICPPPCHGSHQILCLNNRNPVSRFIPRPSVPRSLS